MHAVVRVGKTSPGGMPEVSRQIEEDFANKLSSLPGFISYYVIDTGNDGIITVGVFDDEAQAGASTSLARNWIKENAPELIPTPLEPHTGKVTVHRGK